MSSCHTKLPRRGGRGRVGIAGSYTPTGRTIRTRSPPNTLSTQTKIWLRELGGLRCDRFGLWRTTSVSETGCRAQERHPETVRRFGTRRKLRLEQGRDEEAVVGQFHRARFPADPSCAHAQARGLKLLLVFLVHAVVAVVLLGGMQAPTNRTKPRPRQNRQPFVAGAAGTAGAPVRERA